MVSIRRLVGALVAGTAVTVVLAASVFIAWEVVEARPGIPPAGPACEYEMDVGSGPVGTGVEQVRWTPMPERRCRAVTGEGAGRTWPRPGIGPDIEVYLLWAVLVGVLPLAAGAATTAGVAVLGRRSPAHEGDGRHT